MTLFHIFTDAALGLMALMGNTNADVDLNQNSANQPGFLNGPKAVLTKNSPQTN
ncbi:hypothetical protein JYU34_016966 [Plutella xylostella]|uniref:Uncharacterized protein n=1 Tax=Plutella xylostella TaxID=51655 RepID=A0ABQ7Q3X2_PLUXY|nr:hypothetical protein JYU34_016966 [Plutella xylostella]